jgi:glycosyltransferase involved in cell wall biosynthesis
VHEFESGRQDNSHVMTNEQILKAEIELSAHISGSFTVSRRLADYYSEFCGFSPSVVYNTPRLKPTFDDYGWKYVNIRTAIGAGEDDVVAVYTGIAVKGRGLEKLISSISKFSSLYLVCVGPVTKSNLTYFSNLADRAGCHERLFFHEAVHFDLVSKYISMADFGVIPAIGNLPNQRAGLPNKLFEMIFAGLPVLLADIEQRRVIVEQFGAGIFFPNDNDVVLSQYIEEMLDLLSAPETKQICQRRALSAYELIGWNKQMDIVEQTYLDRLSN